MNITRKEFLQMAGAGVAVVALGRFAPILENTKKDKAIPEAEAQTASWSITTSVTTNPIHVALLHTGKIFYMAGSGWHYGRQLGPYEGRVRDIATGSEFNLATNEDLFCAGQTTLADGTLLFAGGTLMYDTNPDNCNGDWHGESCTYEFNPTTETFTKRADMLHGRWYPTLVTLPDGRVFCYNGYDEYGVNNRIVERYELNKTWTRMPSGTLTYQVGGTQSCGDVTPSYSGAGPTTSFYPRMHLMPSGLLITAGFRPEIRSWNPTSGAWASLGTMATTRHYGTSFLLPLQNTTTERGKILVCNGSAVSTGQSTTSAQILDFNTGNPTVRTTAPTAFARKYPSPVMLPNGKCMIFGGTAQTNINPVRTPELFDPITETWQSLPASTIARYYHSTALLLPDGRVWVTGGNVNSGVWELRTEFFSPPYMTQTRPTTTATPAVGPYGGQIVIQTPNPTAITSVSLLRLMNTTHHYDANQRLIWLQIVARGTSSVTVSAPLNANIAPPGYYMVHVLNSSLVPSVARIIRIPGTASTVDTTPPSVAITSPANNSTHPPGDIIISGTVSDEVGGSGVRDVRVRVDAGAYAAATVSGNTWTRVVNVTATGPHTITVNARDIANNFRTVGIDINVSSAAPDTTPPALTITSPTANATVSSPITVTGTASDAGSGIRDVRVRIDAGTYQTATRTGNNWTISIAAAAGSRRITANARDIAGNFRTAGVTVNVV